MRPLAFYRTILAWLKTTDPGEDDVTFYKTAKAVLAQSRALQTLTHPRSLSGSFSGTGWDLLATEMGREAEGQGRGRQRTDGFQR